MAEGLALGASVLAVLQVSGKVISVCYDYSAAAKDSTWELSQVREGLESLRHVLQLLEPRARQLDLAPATPDAEKPLLPLLCGPLKSCLELIELLEVRLKTPHWVERCGPKRKAAVQALRWPLKESDTKKVLTNIDRFKATFHLAITADQTNLLSAIERVSISVNESVTGSKQDLQSVKHATSFTRDVVAQSQQDLQSLKEATSRTNDMTERSSQEMLSLSRAVTAVHATITTTKETSVDVQKEMKKGNEASQKKSIHEWLSAPDPSMEHNRARSSRQSDTGLWFTESTDFARWKSEKSLLWLHGKPGCGKTVLSSTIIEEVLHRSDDTTKVAYFYFSFSKIEKQTSENMIRSLIAQFSNQALGVPEELRVSFLACNSGLRQPGIDRLMKILEELTSHNHQHYIILDALDECSDGQDLLTRIHEIQGWQHPNLSLLLTSRRHKDIEDIIELCTHPEQRIGIQSSFVDADISKYVHSRLQADHLLKRWQGNPDVQEEIRSTIATKADGM